LALAGSVAIGAYLLIVRDAGESGDGSRLGTRHVVARTYSWGALALGALSLGTHQLPPPVSNYAAWSGILVMALVSQLLGHTALNAALHDFSPTTVAMTTLLEPLVAAVFAAWIFHETLSWQAALGGILVLGAIAVTLRASGRTSAAAAMPS
jgi:drug/metabolite transporter (DMT)-like permease